MKTRARSSSGLRTATVRRTGSAIEDAGGWKLKTFSWAWLFPPVTSPNCWEIATLRQLFATFEGEQVQAHIDEYSETNIEFHQSILRMSGCELLNRMAENLFLHMRSIRMQTITENDRASRSIIDHMHIIEALERRDADLAERLVRQHTLDLAEHVRENASYLD